MSDQESGDSKPRRTRSEIGRYTDLKVWQKAMDMVDAVYEATETLPRHEAFGLIFQVRRAAVSVPCYARGSLTRSRLSFLSQYVDRQTAKNVLSQTVEISKMLSGLMRSLR